MKKFLILTLFVAVAYAVAPELLEKAKIHSEICSKNFDVDLPEAQKMIFSVVTDDSEKNQKFLRCFFERSEFMDEEGKFLTENILTKLGTGLDDAGKAKLSETVTDCTTKITETDVDKRAFLVHNCYYTAQ